MGMVVEQSKCWDCGRPIKCVYVDGKLFSDYGCAEEHDYCLECGAPSGAAEGWHDGGDKSDN